KKISQEVECKVVSGVEGLYSLVEDEEVDIVVSSMIGFVGLKPTLRALESGKVVALANKESIVVGGPIIRNYLNQIVPIDSEHSALFQLMENRNTEDIKEVILTASGGPFWRKSFEELKNVTLEEAAKHPVWKMGHKITIDSATLMNKALEIMEAHFLFSLPYEKIKAVIHPQVFVHSLVVFKDNNVIAHISKPDMRIPIFYALFYPVRKVNVFSSFSYGDLIGKSLEFYEVPNHFRSINLAYSVLANGGVFPAILNAANEVAVDLFSKGKIKFTDIFDIVEDTINCYGGDNPRNLSIEILEEIDNWARNTALNLAHKWKIYKS
ncbi:MAG: 1-deoxy-D-xylulose-5-phosphate reductoisomerase, partial [bacterium]